MSGIPINSGTGPSVAAVTSGTDYIQVVTIASGTMTMAGTVTVAASGPVTVTQTGGNWIVATVSTLLGTVAVSGGGGGAQYAVDSTAMAATGTGTIILGMQIGATTARGLAVTTTGGIHTVFTVATISTLLGTVAVSGGGGGVQYSQGTTALAATGTGTILFGIQSTTAFAVGITGSNQLVTAVANTVTITGTVGALMLQSLDNTNDSVTVFGVQTGSAAKIGLAVNTLGQPIIVQTAQPTRYQAFVIATTSAAGGVIVKTSGAHTLYITDVLVSVIGPVTVGLYSETTGPLMNVYLAANGGFSVHNIQPWVCTTAQSLRVILSSSGTCSVACVGYTVT